MRSFQVGDVVRFDAAPGKYRVVRIADGLIHVVPDSKDALPVAELYELWREISKSEVH